MWKERKRKKKDKHNAREKEHEGEIKQRTYGNRKRKLDEGKN